MKTGRYPHHLPRAESFLHEHDARVCRYLSIVDWAKARYSRDGKVTTFVGCAVAGRASRAAGADWRVPTRYSIVEGIAAAQLLGLRRAFPHETLATALHGA